MVVNTDELIQGLSGAPAIVVGLVLLVLGLLECFAGYRLFRIQVGIICLLGGFGLGWLITKSFTDSWVPALIVGIVVGILLCALSIVVFRVGVFLFVALLTFSLVYALANALEYKLWLALGVGVAAGAVGVFLAKPLIILSTAFGGAGMAVQGGRTLLGMLGVGAAGWMAVVAAIVVVVLGIAGAVSQFRQNKGQPMVAPPRKKAPPPAPQ